MTSSPIACTAAPLSAVDTDLLVVPWFEGQAPAAMAALDEATGGEIARAIASKEFAGRPYDLFITPITDRSWRARRVALAGAGAAAEFGSDLVRKLAAFAGLAARQRRIERVAFVLRGGGRRPATPGIRAGGGRRVDALRVQRRQLQDHGARRLAKPPAWTIAVPDGHGGGSGGALRARDRARPAARRVQQPGARARQRARQYADAAGVRAALRGGDERGRRLRRGARRAADRAARHGPAARRRARQQRAAPVDGVSLRPARARPHRSGARPGRQGDHVRHGRHLDQAGRRHGADEGRHGRRRGGRLRHARDRAAQGADAGHRRRADDREHAGRAGDQAGRHPEERERQDRRGRSTPTPKAG